MLTFFGILGNSAKHNVLAINELTDVEWWNQRWFGQAGLMDMAVHHLWNGVSIATSGAYDANFWPDITEDIRGMVEVIQSETNKVF